MITDRTIQTSDGRQLHLYEAGDPQGAMVLAHHGTPGAGLIWDRWDTQAAARGIRLVAYDRPGYGGSDRQEGRTVADVAADAAAIADACDVEAFRTWGGSGGGPHALACAALLPDRVIAAATIASVAPYEAEGLDWSAGMGQDNLDEFAAAVAGEAELRPFLITAGAAVVAAGPDNMVDALQSLLPPVDAAVLTGEFAAYMYDGMVRGLKPGVDGWLDDDLAFVRPWGFELDSISVPLRLMQGRLDLMVPFSHGEWLAARIPGVVAELSETDGHLSLIDRVDEVHAWLIEQ